MKLILASKSPRRKELLQMLEVPFEIMVSDDEEIITSTDPAKVTEELSLQKAQAVADMIPEGIVIGADTVVADGDTILGKPGSKEEAYRMIHSLQGKTHMVYTGVTILCKTSDCIQTQSFSVGTEVLVMPMSTEEIEWYISTKEPYDKAGGYGIQGLFSRFVEGIRGDYFNVVGLPVHRLYEEMKKMELI